VLADTTSNLSASGKELAISWQKPFDRLVGLEGLTSGELDRGIPRTLDLARTIVEHVEREMKRAAQNDNTPAF
jgi:F420-0:gamma-glutamyl ligase